LILISPLVEVIIAEVCPFTETVALELIVISPPFALTDIGPLLAMIEADDRLDSEAGLEHLTILEEEDIPKHVKLPNWPCVNMILDPSSQELLGIITRDPSMKSLVIIIEMAAFDGIQLENDRYTSPPGPVDDTAGLKLMYEEEIELKSIL